MKSTFLTSIFIAGCLSGSAALAGTTTMAPAATTPVDEPANPWEITLGLYGWGAGLDGNIGAAGMVAPVDIDFSEILDSLDMVAMGMIEARKGPWIFQLEGLYLKNTVKAVGNTPIPGLQIPVKLTAQTTRLEPVIGYRVIDDQRTKLDVLAGFTYYNISNELQVLGPARVRGGKSSDDWIDPIVGLRLNQRLGNRWHFQARADVGGFGASSELVWQALGMIGFDITDSTALYAGYRHAAVDYSKGNFVYDVANSGPIIGLAITW